MEGTWELTDEQLGLLNDDINTCRVEVLCDSFLSDCAKLCFSHLLITVEVGDSPFIQQNGLLSYPIGQVIDDIKMHSEMTSAKVISGLLELKERKYIWFDENKITSTSVNISCLSRKFNLCW